LGKNCLLSGHGAAKTFVGPVAKEGPKGTARGTLNEEGYFRGGEAEKT